tara:strand:+ start:560 stop:910 length:351 start_codon:yes stop_codon:yes gene_type:complete
MSEVVEIYSARGDQGIREGALDYSTAITTREAAEVDAQARCRRDRTIRKVAYYVVRDDGSFRMLFSYQNPDSIARAGRRAPAQKPDTLPRMKGKPAGSKVRKKPGLLDRLKEALRD